MSDWTRIADDAIEATFGPGARLHLLHPEQGRCIAYVEEYAEGGERRVIAIAAGAHHGDACRMLIQQCYRNDHRPTTEEVAVVLGVSVRRVQQLGTLGRLVPAEGGSGVRSARFTASDVWAMVHPA